MYKGNLWDCNIMLDKEHGYALSAIKPEARGISLSSDNVHALL